MIRSAKAHRPPRTILLDRVSGDCKVFSTVLAPLKWVQFEMRYLIVGP